jgi:hypothetical protein
MGKRLLVTALAAAGLSLGFAGVATAAPAKTTVTAPSTVERPAVWFTYDYFETLALCNATGDWLVNVDRRYRAWTCVPSMAHPGLPWALRVLD